MSNDRDWLVKVETAAKVYQGVNDQHEVEYFIDWLFRQYGYLRTEDLDGKDQTEG